MNIAWNHIDTVLLDMDGTLLDLHFDNFFWLTYLPKRYAEHHQVCPEEATIELHRRFNEKRGTLDWYCLEYWSRELRIDIQKLKEEIQHLIQERPFVKEFLHELERAGKSRILITNAHPQSLQLKLAVTGIGAHLDRIISSHQYGHPKESPLFWKKLESELAFDRKRAVFIDDSDDILTAAKDFGIGYVLGIRQPDSQQAARSQVAHPSISHFNEILPAL